MTQTQKSAKNENGIFGGVLRGFGKVIICHILGKKVDQFSCLKNFSAPSTPVFIINDSWCLSIEPFSRTPPPDFGGSIDPPPPSLASPTSPMVCQMPSFGGSATFSRSLTCRFGGNSLTTCHASCLKYQCLAHNGNLFGGAFKLGSGSLVPQGRGPLGPLPLLFW